jgi:hypothetical protein
MPLGIKGFQKGIVLFKGKAHPNWKGGKPVCPDCKKNLSSYSAKWCRKCYKKHIIVKPRKGITFNTGKTHFKKGFTPWNKGKKQILTTAIILGNKRRKGITMPKPKGFSETMRKVNPPLKRIITTAGYVLLFKPNHFGSIDKKGKITEHRYNIECFLNKKLNKSEVIHHLNGDKKDNRLENLYVCENVTEHSKLHKKMERFVYSLIKKGKVYYDGEEFKIRENN